MVKSYPSIPCFFSDLIFLIWLTEASARLRLIVISGHFHSPPSFESHTGRFPWGMGTANAGWKEGGACRLGLSIPHSSFQAAEEVYALWNNHNQQWIALTQLFWVHPPSQHTHILKKKSHSQTCQKFLHLGSSQSKGKTMFRLSGEPGLRNWDRHFQYSR